MADKPSAKPVQAESKPANKYHRIAGESCSDGEHTYMVTSWSRGGGSDKATNVRCQKCLTLVNLQSLESAEQSQVTRS